MDKGLITIAHLSDLHLGYHSGRRRNKKGVNWREVDGYVAFKRMVTDIINDGSIDAVLVAGDVFHTPNPSVRTVGFAQREFRRLADAGLRVYILTGNHDVSDVKTEMAATALLNDPSRHIYAHWEAYAVHEIAPNVLLHMVSHHLYQEQAATWDTIKPNAGAINIFSTHGSVIDPITKLALHTEASPREVIIPDEIVEGRDWNYRLLGHIHERGFVGSSDGLHDTAKLKTYYNGSAIRRGFSDAPDRLDRGWTKWTILQSGIMIPQFKTVAQRPQIDFPVINAQDLSAADVTDVIIDNLTSSLSDAGEDDGSGESWSAAPILRQRVMNITPEKKRAIDYQAISKWSSKALTWGLPMKNDDTPDEEDSIIRLGQSTGTISEQFDTWLKDSDAYTRLQDAIKEQVADETKRLIKQSQDAVLDEA
jgi:predicted MPP superfamily phosphohydrolase